MTDSNQHKEHATVLLAFVNETDDERIPSYDQVEAAVHGLVEQLEASERALAASKEIGKWALETKRCDEPAPQGDMLCDREPGHEGAHVNWQAAEWSQEPPVACACVGGDPCPCRKAAWDKGEPWDLDRAAYNQGSGQD